MMNRNDPDIAPIPGGRLTLSSGVPIATSDVTSAGTLYYTPPVAGVLNAPTMHNYFPVRSFGKWRLKRFTQISLALTVTAANNYDVFSRNGAALVLSSQWTNDTTRADALAVFDGMIVAASDPGLVWLGTIRASGSNVSEDSRANRFIWNADNQAPRQGYRQIASSHTYNSATTRSFNNDATAQIAVVLGETTAAPLFLFGDAFPATNSVPVIRGCLDWTSGAGAGYDDNFLIFGLTSGPPRLAVNNTNVRAIPIGYHYIRITEEEASGSSVSVTFEAAGLTAAWMI